MIFFLVVIILNFIFYLLSDKIAKVLKLYDNPDKIRKIHTNKTSLLGGLIFLINIFGYLIYEVIVNKSVIFETFAFQKNLSTFIFICSLILLFVIGIVDDKFKLSAKLRLALLTIIISINLLVNPELNISLIKLSFMSPFSIGDLSFFWTLLCFLLFINAFNFFDGLNLQSAGLIYSICIFFLYKNIFFNFFIVIFIANTIFLYLNYQSKIFLGNSGSFSLPFLFGALFISSYNNIPSVMADEIVVLMIIPGWDLIRLFFLRIMHKKNPMSADNNHIHHYLIKKFSQTKSAMIIQSLIWIPFSLSQYLGYIHFILVAQTICYFLIIARYRN
jgi:UDP-GlcNAc:undecaprenyl-phosphate GlcNAc-1-phosphate transferase